MIQLQLKRKSADCEIIGATFRVVARSPKGFMLMTNPLMNRIQPGRIAIISLISLITLS